MAGIVALALVAQALVGPPAALPNAPGPSLHLDTAPLDAAMRDYFAGEKREAWAWLGAGLVAAGASTALGAAPGDAAHGASFPLIDIAVVQFGAAAWLLWRTDDQVARLSAQLRDSPCAFFAEEPERMRRVQRRFHIYPLVEATTLVGGAAMAGVGFTGKHDFLAGAGLGLVAQSVVMLVFDQFAAARADAYERELVGARRASEESCRAVDAAPGAEDAR